MHASLVSRETARIALMIAELNDLEVKSADILNAYVQTSLTEKVWTILGPKFSSDARKIAVVVRALYHLKIAKMNFRSNLSRCMKSKRYLPCWADPNLWIRPKNQPNGRFQCYSYLLCNANTILCFHHNISLSHLIQIMANLLHCIEPDSMSMDNKCD